MMTERIKWERTKEASYRAEIGNIYLCAFPEHTRTSGFVTRAAPKTRWRAAVSIWNGKDMLSRYGRDYFANTYATAKEAMQAAETIYKETVP